MTNKTSDEKWLEQFVRRHPSIRTSMRPRAAAQSILHDAKALAPDRIERYGRALAIENVTALMRALQEGDRRTAMKILKPLGHDGATKLLEAIRRFQEGKEGKE